MNILLVGAGAVGQVLGHHFARGGARVAFYVRPRHAEATRKGFTLAALGTRRAPERLEPAAVLTTMAEVAAETWDAVVLCTSSTALRQGTWLAELGPAIGDATLMAIQPGPEDRALVAAHVPAAHIVWAMFPLIAYVTDDVGGPPGQLAFWRPPLQKLPIDGDRARALPLVETLTRGGLPARWSDQVARDLAFAGPLLNLHVVGMECAGWSFAALARDHELLADVHAAAAEVRAAAEKRVGARAPVPLRLVRPWMARIALRLAPRLMPLPAEDYFRVHFTKVGDQTTSHLAAYAAEATALGLPDAGLRRLMTRLAEVRRQEMRRSA